MKNKENTCMNTVDVNELLDGEKNFEEFVDEVEEKIRQEVTLEVMRLMDECD